MDTIENENILILMMQLEPQSAPIVWNASSNAEVLEIMDIYRAQGKITLSKANGRIVEQVQPYALYLLKQLEAFSFEEFTKQTAEQAAIVESVEDAVDA